MSRLLLATTNPGKQRELRRLLGDLSDSLVFPQDLDLEAVEEPHDTYAENAIEKAVAYFSASGLPTLADDSGLEVAALDWGPGVRTARFGGPQVVDRVGLVLEKMAGIEDRRARMVCVLALAWGPSTGEPGVEVFSGTMEGAIASERRGSNGFGYDPIFLLPSGQTAAELARAEKDRVSHRGKAVALALPRIREVLAGP